MSLKHSLVLSFCGLLAVATAMTGFVLSARAFTAERIADVNPSGTSWPSEFTIFGGNLVFRADDGTGHEPWIWNGTDPPYPLEINPLGDSDPLGFTVFGTELVFSAHDGSGSQAAAGGLELQPSSDTCGLAARDGAAAFATEGLDVEPWAWVGAGAPRQIADINAAGSSNPHGFVVFGGRLVFSAHDGTNYHLWSWNGSDPPAEIEPEPGGWYCSLLTEAAVHAGELIFRAHDGTGDEPWAWNGSDPPRKIAEINPTGTSNPNEFTVFGGEIVFSAFDGAHDGLWAWDGVGPPGKIADIGMSPSSVAHGFTVFGGELAFRANESATSAELWAWNRANPPRKIADISPSKGSHPSPLVVLGGELVFSGRDQAGSEPWAWNGADPPRRLADINLAGNSEPCEFTVFGNDVVFDAFDGYGWALWAWNGSDPPRRIIEADLGWAVGNEFSVFGDLLVFRGDDGDTGFEPWALRASRQDLLDDLADLRNEIMAMGLEQGFAKSLVAKLAPVEPALIEERLAFAADKLDAFIGVVLGQRGNRLSAEQADALIADAQAIIVLLPG